MMFRKFLKYAAISIASLAALLILLVTTVTLLIYHNQDKIYQYVIDAINEQQNGLTEIGHINISPVKNFPYVSIGLHDVKFYEDKEKTLTPLYEIGHLYAGFDLLEIIRGNYTVKKIKIEDGYLRLVMLEDGTLNILNAKKGGNNEQKDEGGSPINFNLKSIKIKNFNIEETNLQSDKFIALHINKVKTSFKLGSEYILVSFNSDLVLNQYRSGKTVYFKEKAFTLKTTLEYFKQQELLNISKGDLLVEQGSLDLTGSIDFKNDIKLDLNLFGKKKNFDLFISFAPEEIHRSLSRFKNKGDIYFKGKIAGPVLYQNPSIDIELGCENTFFFNKDNSKAIKDLTFKGRFHTGKDNTPETSEFVLSNLYGVPESGMFKGTFRVVNFVNPVVSFDFHADVDMVNFKSFYDAEWFEDGGGKIKVDITINEFIGQDSIVHIASQLEDGTMSKIVFDNAWIKTKAYHNKIEQLNGEIIFNGDNLDLKQLTARVANSDLSLSAQLRNINCLLHKYDAPLELKVHAESKKLDVAKLLPPAMHNEDSTWKTEVIHDLVVDLDFNTTVNALDKYQFLPEMSMKIRNFTGSLEGYAQIIHEVSGTVQSSDEQLVLKDLKILLGENDLKATLQIDKPYLLKDRYKSGKVHYAADIQAEKIDFKSLLHYRGKPLLDPDTEAALGKELVQHFHFKGDGYIYPSTFTKLGFRSNCKIERFTVKLNDLPKIANTRGRLRTDSSGCLYLEDFYCEIGKSDFKANLALNHLLDNQKNRRNIKGKISGKVWDIDELMQFAATADDTASATVQTKNEIKDLHTPAFNIFSLPFPVADFHFDIGIFKHQRYKLENLKGHIKANREHQLFIDTLHFLAADGAVGIKGYLNGKDKEQLYLAGKIKLKQVDLDKIMLKMDNFGQDYVVNNQLHGRIDALIDAKVRLYADLTPKLDFTEALITMNIQEGRLENFGPMQAMSAFMGDRNLNNIRFGALENTLEYKNGLLIIPRMKIASTLGYIFVSGRQHLDNTMNYEVQVPMSLIRNAGWNLIRNKLLGGKRKPRQQDLAEVDEEIISEQRGLIRRYMTFNISGKTENFDVSLGRNRNLQERETLSVNR